MRIFKSHQIAQRFAGPASAARLARHSRSGAVSSALLLVALLGVVALPAAAQHRENDQKHAATGGQAFADPSRVSPNRTATVALGDSQITVEWGAPRVRGRRLSGGLISTYKVWRMGANEATVIHFPEDMLIEGESIPAGTYSVFAIGGKKAWTFIFNSDAQQWGAFTYSRADDVLRVKVPPGTGAQDVEEMTLSFEESTDSEAQLYLRWGTIEVKCRVQLASAGA